MISNIGIDWTILPKIIVIITAIKPQLAIASSNTGYATVGGTFDLVFMKDDKELTGKYKLPLESEKKEYKTNDVLDNILTRFKD